ncbi:hypothetical protein DOY81_010396 [Sarcophaga bullata]|nr:hypothetical protein DOY81_010396 [Sarcophaga bullata]
MKHLIISLGIAVIASTQVYAYSAGNAYQQQSVDDDAVVGEYQLQGNGHVGLGDASSSATAGASANAGDVAAGFASALPSSLGSNQNIPYQPGNTRGNSVSSSISYPNNKGEILIHRPAAIIVKRPPTKVVVNHPPLVVKPAPVVLHKPPAVVVRKVFVKHHPRPVKVEPVYVNVVKPPAEKYFVNEKQQKFSSPQTGYAPVNVNAGFGSLGNSGSATDVDNAAANAGYQLLQNNQGLAALANLSGSGGYSQGGASAHSSYSGSSY